MGAVFAPAVGVCTGPNTCVAADISTDIDGLLSTACDGLHVDGEGVPKVLSLLWTSLAEQAAQGIGDPFAHLIGCRRAPICPVQGAQAIVAGTELRVAERLIGLGNFAKPFR